MKKIYILLNLLFANIFAFSPSNVFKSNFKNTPIKIYKPKINNDNKENIKNIVFYRGGNSIIPSEIYNNFLKT